MASTAALAQPPDLSDFDTYRLAQDYMLYLINQERSRAGLKRVRLDALASQAAKLHAEDMLKGGYLSHWNMEGLKPARRYNLLGGIDGLGENVFYTSGRLGTMHELIDEAMDTLMSSEGHRLTILGASYTHVGLGFALGTAERSFYTAQEFVSRIGGEYYCPLYARVGGQIELSGRFDRHLYSLEHVIVGFEERPKTRSRRWLMRSETYRDADKLFAGYSPEQNVYFPSMATYHDITVDDAGWFKCRVLMDYKGREGMYYLFVWLREKRGGMPVLAAVATVDVTK